MSITWDNGHGSMTGSWLYIRTGAYLNDWWHGRNKGPGNARQPGTPCGHTGLDHCQSGHCTRWVCRNIPKLPLMGRLIYGRTLRIWTGPAYHRGEFKRWRNGIHHLRLQHACHPHGDTYKLISFR